MPLLEVDQFGPSFSVTIKGRQGSNVQEGDINNDLIAISTTRQLNSPSGAWAVTLISRRDKGGRTWAQRIRPMDYVEIRFGRYKKRSQGQNNKPQMIMRGFVSQVTETVSMDQNGQPFRQTTVTGQDMGKLLLIRQIYVLPELGSEGALAGGLQEQANEGELGAAGQLYGEIWDKIKETESGETTLKPQEFLDRLKKYIFNSQSSGLTQGGSGTNLPDGVPELKFTAKDMDKLKVNVGFITTFTGPVWNLIQAQQGIPVCELFVHDTEDDPELVWRWAPYKDKDGKVIDPVSDAGQSTELSLREIMQYSVSTSDKDVPTAYFTYPSYARLWALPYRMAVADQATGGSNTQQGAPAGGEGQNPLVRQELAKRYGFKYLEVAMPLIPVTEMPTDKNFQDDVSNWQDIGQQITKWLDKAFSHSVNLEQGTIVIRGNEKLDIGTYVKFKETREEFYIEAIRHDFILNPPRFSTTLTVSRGLWSSPSPYPDDEGEAGVSGSGGQSGGGSQSGGGNVDPGTGKEE